MCKQKRVLSPLLPAFTSTYLGWWGKGECPVTPPPPHTHSRWSTVGWVGWVVTSRGAPGQPSAGASPAYTPSPSFPRVVAAQGSVTEQVADLSFTAFANLVEVVEVLVHPL